MFVEKSGVIYKLTDATHIDAFRRSGWKEIPPSESTPESEKKKPVKKAGK